MPDRAGVEHYQREPMSEPHPTEPREPMWIRELLQGILTQDRNSLIELVFGNFDRREAVLHDSPGTRSHRVIIPRWGEGSDALAVPQNVLTQVCAQSEGVLGGSVVNVGANPVYLYQCSAGELGGAGNALAKAVNPRPCKWLAAGGGAYDLRDGNALYGGDLVAYCPSAGGTTLVWARF